MCFSCVQQFSFYRDSNEKLASESKLDLPFTELTHYPLAHVKRGICQR